MLHARSSCQYSFGAQDTPVQSCTFRVKLNSEDNVSQILQSFKHAAMQFDHPRRTQLSISKKNTGRESLPFAPLTAVIVEFQRGMNGEPSVVRGKTETGRMN